MPAKPVAIKAKTYNTIKRSMNKKTFFTKEIVYLESVCENNLILITVAKLNNGKQLSG